MFSIYSATKGKKKKPLPLIFRIVKGRNNDFLFGMHFFCLSLVEF